MPAASDRQPYRIGLLQDWAIGRQPTQDWYDAIRLALDDAVANGVLDRPVELVLREIEGMPYSQLGPIQELWEDLAFGERCTAIVGPHFSYAALAMREQVNAARIPTIVNAGTLGWYGEHCFAIPNGSFCDEAALMARYLARAGSQRVAVIHDDNPLGDEYYVYFKRAARREGLAVAADVVMPTFADQAEAGRYWESGRASGADGVAYMGYGGGGLVLKAFNALEWDVPRVVSSIFLGLTPDLGYGFELGDFEGWAGIDQVDTANPVLQHMLGRFEKEYGRRPLHCFTALGWDFGTAIAEGLALSRPVSPQGFKDGLEQVRMVPAAIGRPGTVMSFGPYDHRAYKGGDYVLLRAVVDGELVDADPTRWH